MSITGLKVLQVSVLPADPFVGIDMQVNGISNCFFDCLLCSNKTAPLRALDNYLEGNKYVAGSEQYVSKSRTLFG